MEALKMVALIDKNNKKKTESHEEFEKYISEQRTSTTFNGLEVAEFSWYKRVMGLKTI
jgi:hypothetical protein